MNHLQIAQQNDNVNEIEVPAQRPPANPFTCYEVQKLIVKYTDHWTFRQLRKVSQDYNMISKRRELKISRVKILLDDFKITFQIFDANTRKWIEVKYKKLRRGCTVTKGEDEPIFVKRGSAETLFFNDFIRVLRHRNTTQLEELEFDIVEDGENEGLKKNLPCKFLQRKKLLAMAGTIEVKKLKMKCYEFDCVAPGYRLQHVLSLLKPGVLETINLQFWDNRILNDARDQVHFVDQFENIWEREQWMQAKHLITRETVLETLEVENWSHFETVRTIFLNSDDVSDLLNAFIEDPPLQGCTISVMIELDLEDDMLDDVIEEAEIDDDENILIFHLPENRVLLVHIEEFRIRATVENAVGF